MIIQPNRPPDYVWVGASIKYLFWFEESTYGYIQYSTGTSYFKAFSSVEDLIFYIKKNFNPHSQESIKLAYEKWLNKIEGIIVGQD